MKSLLPLCATVVLLAKFSAADPNPLCPYPSEDFTRFQYEGDCSKYWECYEGNRYPMSCPTGLEYNVEKSVCDFPADANCDGDATVTYPTFPTGLTTSSTTPGDDDTLCTGVADGSFHGDPTDCSKYYECLYGKVIPGQCPLNLVWNEDKLTCDYPENVDCTV